MIKYLVDYKENGGEERITTRTFFAESEKEFKEKENAWKTWSWCTFGIEWAMVSMVETNIDENRYGCGI